MVKKGYFDEEKQIVQFTLTFLIEIKSIELFH